MNIKAILVRTMSKNEKEIHILMFFKYFFRMDIWKKNIQKHWFFSLWGENSTCHAKMEFFSPRVSSLCYVGYVICIYSYLEGFFYKALLSLIIFSFFQSKLYINTYYKKIWPKRTYLNLPNVTKMKWIFFYFFQISIFEQRLK